MEVFFFRPDLMQKFYNCSGRSEKEWEALANPNHVLGTVYFIMGAIYFFTYLPFVIVMFKSDLTSNSSCYKIMLFLGCIDIICIPIGGFLGGYFAFYGMIYCMSPRLLYISGSIALSCWFSGSLTVLILGFNRCLDFAYPNIAETLFSSNKTFLWLLIPASTFIYFNWFYTTIIFNANLYAFFFDPFVGLPERNGLIDNDNYPHNFHSMYNIFFVVSLFLLYLWLCITLLLRTRKMTRMNKIQRQIFTQSLIICSTSFVAGLTYVYMQFFPTPLYVIIGAEILWLSSHGNVGIIYAIFNPTLRKKVLQMFFGREDSNENFTTNNAAAINAMDSAIKKSNPSGGRDSLVF